MLHIQDGTHFIALDDVETYLVLYSCDVTFITNNILSQQQIQIFPNIAALITKVTLKIHPVEC